MTLGRQLKGYRLTTADILYWPLDHSSLLQSFVWQNLDLAPKFPALSKFLNFWLENLNRKVHEVRIASSKLIKPPSLRFTDG